MSENEKDKDLQEKIGALIQFGGERADNEDLIREIIITALRLSQNHVTRGDLKIIHAAVKEMRYAFKLFAPYKEIRKVSVFGSARTRPTEPIYELAAEFAEQITAENFMVITGAGEGIMRAVQGGSGRKNSFGMNILLPFEQAANEFIENDPKLMTFKYFFTRKLFFIKEANAIALFPGGFGTHDEGFEALTLLQTGKSNPLPVVFIDIPGGTYWKAWRAFVEDEILSRGLISEEDLSLFKVTDRVDVAVSEITNFYRNYHSIRFVRDQLVVRLNHPATEERLERLNDLFSDIVASGKITRTEALPEEANEPKLLSLPRIGFHFNRKGFGRLRQMIDTINLY
ncbi:MAG TPA: LOG family protein [Candidatus Manganitrophaceae bacterium]|nr:LOG family protein [Candidatus Manganitrophaceae bacterium]